MNENGDQSSFCSRSVTARPSGPSPIRSMWSTDGNNAEKTGRADGLWSMETDGERRGTSRHFFRVPVGAEMCGPFFTADDETLFLAHPWG